MILATDTQYGDDTALSAGVLFSKWTSDKVDHCIIKTIDKIEPYQSGSFYKRELPCILALLDDIHEQLEVIVIDGFVNLGHEAKDGLGMRLYDAIDRSTQIIGVAKKAFINTPKVCQLLRGTSQKPLFVTSVGIPLNDAKNHVKMMHGQNRIPTQLKKVDQLCRGIICAG